MTIRIVAVLALLALFATAVACKDSRPKASTKGVDPVPLPPAMPSTRVDARDILGKPEAEARTAFGATGDTRTIDNVALDLVIDSDSGIAVELGVRMPDARARRDDITQWLQLGHKYWFTLGERRFSVDTRADDHVRIVDEERALRLDPDYPGRVRQTFAEIMAEGASLTTGLNVAAEATGAGHYVLRFTLPVCDTVMLQRIQSDPTLFEQLRRADFRRLECTNGNAHAALELAGPAVLRREFATEFERSFTAAGQTGVRITTSGADDIVIQVHWADCTAASLQALIGNIEPMLVERGFTRIECADSLTPGGVNLQARR